MKIAKQQKSQDRLKDSQRIHEGFLKIKLKLLKLEDRNAYSEQILERVLLWTGGQSFLTQKLFKLISKNSNISVPDHKNEQIDREGRPKDAECTATCDLDSKSESVDRLASRRAGFLGLSDRDVDDLVQTKIIDDWSNNELAEHFNAIQNRLLNSQQCEPRKLLQLYQQILIETVSIDNSKEQQELINMGLVVKHQNQLIASNRIYQSVFSLSWVTKKLTHQTSPSVPVRSVNEYYAEVVPLSRSKGKNNFWQLKRVLLLLASAGLLWVFFNSIAKRIVVRLTFSQGNELLQKKSFEAAIAEYNRLLNIDSNYYQAWTNRGYALAGLQQYEEMRQSCSTATIIEPTAAYPWNCQGEAWQNLGREEKAIAAFDRAIALKQTEPIFLLNKSESLEALGQNEESLAVIEQAIQLLQVEAADGKKSTMDQLAVALTFLGNRYQQNEQYELAVDAYNQALEYSSNYFPAQINQGIVLAQAERYQAAQNVLENILDSSDLTEAQRGQTWFYLGKTLCRSQQTVTGIAALEQAIKFQPDYRQAVETKRQCT